MKTCRWIPLFILLFTALLTHAQPITPQPVADLVIQVSENLNDIILNWSRPLNADGFQIHSGDSLDFQATEATQIGSTPDTTFTHMDGLIGAERRFYTVIAISKMVLVPEGSFVMGSSVVGDRAIPEHTVNVPAFYMDIYEVTNAQYKAFCDATNRGYPSDYGLYSNYFCDPDYADYPVVNVDWNDAQAYATWAGKRLPTEAEWERAAKGNTDNRIWPWGDTWIGTNANTYNNPEDGYWYTSPVGNYPNGISPVGCYDMCGNVWEWCEDDMHDNYNGAPTDGSAWIENPRDPIRVLRGGAWYYFYHADPRCASRGALAPLNHSADIGFRCARTP